MEDFQTKRNVERESRAVRRHGALGNKKFSVDVYPEEWLVHNRWFMFFK